IQVSSQLTSTDGVAIEPQQVSFTTIFGDLALEAVEIDGTPAGNNPRLTEVPLTLDIVLRFTVPLDESSVQGAVGVSGVPTGGLQVSLSSDKREIHVKATQPLDYLTKYELTVSEGLQGEDGQAFSGTTRTLYTD